MARTNICGVGRHKGVSNLKYFGLTFAQQLDVCVLDVCQLTPATLYAAVRDGEHVHGWVIEQRRDFKWGSGEYSWWANREDTVALDMQRCPQRILDLLSDPHAMYETGPATLVATARDSAVVANARTKAARKARPSVSKGDLVLFKEPVIFTDGERRSDFRFVKGNQFACPKDPNTEYEITKWRQLPYTVIPKDAPAGRPALEELLG